MSESAREPNSECAPLPDPTAVPEASAPASDVADAGASEEPTIVPDSSAGESSVADSSEVAALFSPATLPAAKRPPIRPVGFRAAQRPATLLIVMSVLQLGLFAYGTFYFYDLSRYDWRAYIDWQSKEPTDLLLDDEIDEQGFTHTERIEAMRRYDRFGRDLLFLVPAHLLMYWGELAAVMWWQYRTHRNLAPLGTMGVRFQSGWSLVWWLVPIAALWMPLLVIQEIWRGSDPSVPVGDARAWRMRRSSLLAGLWWSLWIVAKVLFHFAAFLFLLSAWTIVSPGRLLLSAVVLGLVATALQIALVRRVSKRQRALYLKRTRAADKAEAAGEPVVDAIVSPESPTAAANAADRDDATAPTSTESREDLLLTEADLAEPAAAAPSGAEDACAAEKGDVVDEENRSSPSALP